MQQRFRILRADSFEEASEAKVKLLAEFPERTFQIRKSRGEFVLVERKSVAASNEIHRPKKKRGQM